MATMLRRGFLAAVVALLISAHPHAPTGSAQSLSPALPAKEYVYANTKLLAVEVPFALSVTPPTASIPPGAAQRLSHRTPDHVTLCQSSSVRDSTVMDRIRAASARIP